MPAENVLHIKLGYEEAVRVKRNFLLTEMSALKIAKNIGRYRFFRLEELGLKIKINNRIKETNKNIRKLQTLLPIPKMPRILKRQKKEEEEIDVQSQTYEPGDIESQLRDIQARLESLQG